MKRNLKIILFNGKWAIEEEGDIPLRIVHNSKHDAIREAKKLARINNSEVTLYDSNGEIYPIYL